MASPPIQPSWNTPSHGRRDAGVGGGKSAGVGGASSSAPKEPGAALAAAAPGGPPASCDSLWNKADAEAAQIAKMPDPIARNKEISAKYAQLYESDKKLSWVGLASVVSRQAGCAMDKAKDAAGSYNPLVSGPARNAYDALADGNKTIFSDIYPVAKFYHDNGLQRLKQCNRAADGQERAPPRLVKALEQIDQGTPEAIRSGSDAIADYEQRDIVQDRIYSVERYRKALESNEWWAKNPIGRYFGATRPELPLSSTCGGTPVPFEGSLTDPDARVRYYNKLMNGFEQMGQQQRDRIVSDIARQATGR